LPVECNEEPQPSAADILHLYEKEYDTAIAYLATTSITECGSGQPDKCYLYVATNILNRLRIAKQVDKTATVLDIVSEPEQYSGWKKKLPPELYAKNIKRAIDNAAAALSNTKPVFPGTCFLNPKHVKKRYGHIPAWSTDDMGSLKSGLTIGDHYFINEIIAFKYKGKVIGK
jgi:hypothetical protein